ncbi:MAG TPA: DUF4920 domain-containing protein [Aquaticitalea sp.]|nr:DUF4920 domain-containing protein [Aquaticitalea sp.]
MKNIYILLMLTSIAFSCKDKTQETDIKEVEKREIAYASFGDKITDENVIATEQIANKLHTLNVGDTITAKTTAKVIEVCQMKGCWMTLDMGGGEEATVRFKDYAFFMPKNIAGKEVIIDGKAYVDVVSVEDQRHYAEDAGKTKEEIAAITDPKKTYTFMADGVLVKED